MPRGIFTPSSASLGSSSVRNPTSPVFPSRSTSAIILSGSVGFVTYPLACKSMAEGSFTLSPSNFTWRMFPETTPFTDNGWLGQRRAKFFGVFPSTCNRSCLPSEPSRVACTLPGFSLSKAFRSMASRPSSRLSEVRIFRSETRRRLSFSSTPPDSSRSSTPLFSFMAASRTFSFKE